MGGARASLLTSRTSVFKVVARQLSRPAFVQTLRPFLVYFTRMLSLVSYRGVLLCGAMKYLLFWFLLLGSFFSLFFQATSSRLKPLVGWRKMMETVRETAAFLPVCLFVHRNRKHSSNTT